MANTPSQLLRLADHTKLSLLERQRAISLNLPPNTQDAEVTRSLETLREGIEGLDAEHPDQSRLRARYNELYWQFHGTGSSLSNLAQSQSQLQPPSSLKRAISSTSNSKSVRFSDSPSTSAADEAARAALFPYKDDPSDAAPDQSGLDNTQIHAYHTHALAEQDEQLDVLGQSIGRQRELSIQIGDELDDQVMMLDEVDGHVTRHQTQIDRARKRVGNIARKAKDNMSFTVIIILIVVLVLLIVLLN